MRIFAGMERYSEVRGLVWDWNGTLLDDAEACVRSINRMLARRGLACIDPERYREVFGFPVRQYYETVGFDLLREDWDAVAVEFHDAYAEFAVRAGLRAGARETLLALRESGLRMAVLSSCEQAMLEGMLQAHGVKEFFTEVCGQPNLHGGSKVNTGRLLVAEIGLRPQELLLVGDTTHDFEVAQEIGCRCVLLTGGHQSEPRLRRCGCPVLSGPDELRRIFETLARPTAGC